MDMSELIERTKQNIWQAISDYGNHTDQTSVMDDCTANFVNQLASDSCYAKQELRELFSKSPVWDANLDALVINGTRTHDPDPDRIYALGTDILSEAIYRADNSRPIYDAIRFFYDPNFEQEGIAAIKQLAPKAYAPNKKKSRVFKALCQALGVADETAGSDFQRLYAQFADELTSKKIGFKLYVSINPAHFITMSNPKGDHRGTTLTSCHSFNSTEYEYNNGCTGYARDKVSFIAFTVADPADKETLNNRKTTRQVFAYKPGNGLLLQSRMYNTSGGVYGASEDSKLYRDLIQREISMLENVPNLWKTYSSTGDMRSLILKGSGFGGYPDWAYENFDGHISIRADCDEDTVDPLVVGTYGLCIVCGNEIDEGLYCCDCKHGSYVCDECGCRCEELFDVRNSDGEWIQVCERCRDDNYVCCEECGEYWPEDNVTYVDGGYYCDSCLDEYCEECDECWDYHRSSRMYDAYRDGEEVRVCENCRDEDYYCCDRCGDLHHGDDMRRVYKADGYDYLCEDCSEDFTLCPHCGELIEVKNDGTCPHCGVVVEEMEEEAV